MVAKSFFNPHVKHAFIQETISSASSVTQALNRELAESQRNRLALTAAGSNPLVTQLSNGPLGALLEKVCTSLDQISYHEYFVIFCVFDMYIR